MARKRYQEEQIISILKRVEAGQKMSEVCRDVGVTQTTYYKWKQKYGNMEVSEARKLRKLEAENGQLKRLVADLSLDNRVLKDVIEKKL